MGRSGPRSGVQDSANDPVAVAAWQAAYSIEKAVSIDACTIAFKEHVFMLQYMKKPNKLGIN